MKNDEVDKAVPANGDFFDASSNKSFIADQIYPTPASFTSSDSCRDNSRSNQTNNDQENDKPPSRNVKNPFISIAAAVLCGAGVLMVIQYIFIIGILIIGNLLITVNPDTGEKINGPEGIIPSILGEWSSFLIFVIGIACLFISYKAFKSNNTNTHKRVGARIVTKEEKK